MLNHVFIQGRVVRDLELRRTHNETPVCSFTLACERDFKDADGTKKTDFIDCVAFRNTAEFICKHFAKGRMMIVGGRLQTRKWEDKTGTKHLAWEVGVDSVYFGDSRKDTSSTCDDDEPHYVEVTEDGEEENLPF